ncbi:MAG: hypothetical protein ACI865_002202 [Flavobacteriaceae bacterium]
MLGFLSPIAHAGKIKKGFQALEMHDYFTAKKKFSGGLKYNTSPAAYGLALIYATDNNPFYSKDSAYLYLELSEKTYATSKQKRRLKWAHYGWSVEGILKLRREIEDLFHLEARLNNTVAGYTTFIEEHPRASQVPAVIITRDSIVFFDAVNQNTALAYGNFVRDYPNSVFTEMAQDNYFDAQFAEITGDGSLASFLAFLELNPESPMVPYAEQEVFNIVTLPNSVEAYDVFIRTYPSNQYIDSAWREIYQVYISDYSDSTLRAYRASYPDSPYISRVDEEIELINVPVFPNLISGKYGFIGANGIQEIPVLYQEVTAFHEGLSIVAKDGKYGVIDRKGVIQIPFVYDAISDFEKGVAIVEKGDKMGLIQRNGHLVLKCDFEDLGMISDGLVYGSMGGEYGYYDAMGRERIAPKYDDAFDFHNGIAKVELYGLQAYIDIYDVFVAQPAHSEIELYSDSLFVFTANDLMGLMDRLAKVVVPAQYDEIGPLHNGLAVAAIDGEVVYLNELGEIVIQGEFEVYPNFMLSGEFIDGQAIAMKNELYGRIDQKGTTVTSFKYQNLGIGKSVFPFQKGGAWGVLNRSGKTVVSAKYSDLKIENDLVFAESDEGTGVMTLGGTIIVPFEFDAVELLSDSLYIVQMEETYGLFKDGALITSIIYTSIGRFGEDFVFLNEPGKLSYYEISSGKIISTKIGDSE